MQTHDEVMALLAKHGFDLPRATVEALARPALQLVPSRVEPDSHPIGATMLSCYADVPPDFDWPEFDDEPMMPLAQISLAEVAALDWLGDALPSTGWLVFFMPLEDLPYALDKEDAEKFKVAYFDAPVESLVRRNGIEDAPEIPFCRVDMVPSLHLPHPSDGVLGEALGLPDDYDEEAWDAAMDEVRGHTPGHWLFGHPHPIQSHVRAAAMAAAVKLLDRAGVDLQDKAAAREAEKLWQLLLQLDEDEEPDGPKYVFEDDGRAHFMIHQDDLKRHDFSGVWMHVEFC